MFESAFPAEIFYFVLDIFLACTPTALFRQWSHVVLLAGNSKGEFFQAEDGIRDRSPSRGLGDVYKRQIFI